jgi:hypothetical protein
VDWEVTDAGVALPTGRMGAINDQACHDPRYFSGSAAQSLEQTWQMNPPRVASISLVSELRQCGHSRPAVIS